jgi:hypothetical protein
MPFSYSTAASSKTQGVHDDVDDDGSYKLGDLRPKKSAAEREADRLAYEASQNKMVACALCGVSSRRGDYGTCRCMQHDLRCPACKGSFHYCRAANGEPRTGHPCQLCRGGAN